MYCLRVSKGSEWGREEVRAEGKEVEVIEKDIPLKKGKERGRIVSFRADITGKLGSKVSIVVSCNFGNLTFFKLFSFFLLACNDSRNH